MSALTQHRNTVRRAGDDFAFEAATVIFQGGMVSMDASGKAVPASNSGTLAVGVAITPALTGESVTVARGVYCFENSAGADALTRADVGTQCFVADAHTVKKTAGTPTAPVAGMVMDVDMRGVWVKF